MPAEPLGIVVGVAVLEEGRVLAARRTSPPDCAGRWEFPGGKVEPGESVAEAAVREVAEELGCVVRVVGEPLDCEAALANGTVLRVVPATLESGDPIPHEHDAIRWLAADELGAVDWLQPDRPFLPLVRELAS